MQIAAVVLAGGAGTRIRRLLPDLPKPLAPVAGQPFLHWVLWYLREQGVESIVISTGYLGGRVEQYVTESGIRGVQCQLEPAPLGTAGGFLFAADRSGLKPDAWLVCNGDSLALADLSPLFRALDDPETQAAILGVRVEDAARYGTLQTDPSSGRRLARFAEKRPGAGLVNAGVYLLRAGSVEHLPRNCPLSFEFDVFTRLLDAGADIEVVGVDVPFLDIGTEESLLRADRFIGEHVVGRGKFSP
jgi:D-glycero-alpha-D-manno-heptose 1-phosphate guanylyltransferase